MKKILSLLAIISVVTFGMSFLTYVNKSEEVAYHFDYDQTDSSNFQTLGNKILPGG